MNKWTTFLNFDLNQTSCNVFRLIVSNSFNCWQHCIKLKVNVWFLYSFIIGTGK